MAQFQIISPTSIRFPFTFFRIPAFILAVPDSIPPRRPTSLPLPGIPRPLGRRRRPSLDPGAHVRQQIAHELGQPARDPVDHFAEPAPDGAHRAAHRVADARDGVADGAGHALGDALSPFEAVLLALCFLRGLERGLGSDGNMGCLLLRRYH